MSNEDVVTKYEGLANEELTQVVVTDYDLTQAILSSHPEMAQDAGFELFDTDWAKRYWRNVLSEISGIKASDKLLSWATGASIAGVANLLIAYYQLPAVAFSAAVALTVILVRAAKAASASQPKP
jgi:hypothetical protein